MRALFVLFFSFSVAAADLPEAVLKAKQSTFRILFLAPNSEIQPVSLAEYEAQIEKVSEKDFHGWWLHQLARKARAANLEKLKVRYIGDSFGTASLVSDSSTLYTAAHVYQPLFDIREKLGALPRAQMKAVMRDKIVGRRIDFVLLNEKRELIYDSGDLPLYGVARRCERKSFLQHRLPRHV